MLKRILLAAMMVTGASLAAHAQEFTFGLIMPLTGANAEVGKAYVLSANAGIEMVNKRGGIGGLQAKLVVCDSRSVEQEAVLCARRLGMQDKVNVLLGTGSTPQTMAVLPTVEAASVPIFVFAAGTALYEPVKKWVFKGIPTNDDQIPAVMDFLKAKNWTKAAIIRDNGPYGQDVSGAIKAYADKAGIQIVADEVYSPADTDMTAQMTRLREKTPDAIFNLALIPPAGATIVRNAAQLGMNAAIFVGLNMQNDNFVSLVGDASKNLYFVGTKVTLSTPIAGDPLFGNINEFREIFAKANPSVKMSSLAGAAVDAILLTQAAAKGLGAKATDAGALLGALEKLTNEPGLNGVWTLSSASHTSDLKSGMALVQSQGGNWVAAK